MKSYIVFRNQQQSELPPQFQNTDVRFPSALVEHFLTNFTQEGDIVFDPFAGFGTTLQVAETMNRIGFGIEAYLERCQYAQSLLNNPSRLIHGDARQLASYSLPPFDFSLTSPPYMGNSVHGASCTQNPLADASVRNEDYHQYLQDLQDVYRQMATMMKSEARIVIEVANLKHKQGITTLAWDMAHTVSEVLQFEGEIVACWEDGYGYGYDHSYCLVFKRYL